MWAWCFRAELYTPFKTEPARSAGVLLGVLGREFDGVMGRDCFSAYRRHRREALGVKVQLCLAHLIRDVEFLTAPPGLEEGLYGERLLMTLKQLFGVIHRREQMPGEGFARRLWEARD